MSRIVRQEL